MIANPKLCQKIYAAKHWPSEYNLGFLVSKILPVSSIKIRLEKGKYIATAPKMHRYEGDTAEDAAAKFVLALIKEELL